MGLILILLVGLQLLALAEGAAGEVQWCRLLGKTHDLHQVYECQGVSPLLLLPYLWSPLVVTVRCSNARVRLQEGRWVFLRVSMHVAQRHIDHPLHAAPA